MAANGENLKEAEKHKGQVQKADNEAEKADKESEGIGSGLPAARLGELGGPNLGTMHSLHHTDNDFAVSAENAEALLRQKIAAAGPPRQEPINWLDGLSTGHKDYQGFYASLKLPVIDAPVFAGSKITQINDGNGRIAGLKIESPQQIIEGKQTDTGLNLQVRLDDGRTLTFEFGQDGKLAKLDGAKVTEKQKESDYAKLLIDAKNYPQVDKNNVVLEWKHGNLSMRYAWALKSTFEDITLSKSGTKFQIRSRVNAPGDESAILDFENQESKGWARMTKDEILTHVDFKNMVAWVNMKTTKEGEPIIAQAMAQDGHLYRWQRESAEFANDSVSQMQTGMEQDKEEQAILSRMTRDSIGQLPISLEYKGSRADTKTILQGQALVADLSADQSVQGLYTFGAGPCAILMLSTRGNDGKPIKIAMAHLDANARQDDIRNLISMMGDPSTVTATVVSGEKDLALELGKAVRASGVELKFADCDLDGNRDDAAIIDRNGKVYFGSRKDLSEVSEAAEKSYAFERQIAGRAADSSFRLRVKN